MAAIICANDDQLINGFSAKKIHAIAHARQKRIQLPNLRSVLGKFTELQIDADGRGLVIAYDTQNEMVSVVDRQLLLYRRYSTVKWPWEEIIEEVGDKDEAYSANEDLFDIR